VIYLYDKALVQVHEYEADKETSVAVGSTSYASMLLAIAVRKKNPSLTHSFVRNPLKGRIKMLFSNPSENRRKLMYLAALPIGLALIWTFAVQVVYANIPEPITKQRTEQTSKPTPFKPVHVGKAARKVIPIKELKIKKPAPLATPSDTLWMVASRNHNRYSEVIIDGKPYAIDILTRISPSCLKSIIYGRGKIDITTKNNKIEYATKIDRENAIVRDKARVSDKPYIRYAQKNQDGSRYDYIEINTKEGAGGSVSLDKGKKLLLIYEGKQYSERKFKALTNDQLINRAMRFSSFDEPKEEINVKYGRGYGSMIEIFKPEVRELRVFRDPLNANDANSRVSYSAKDSVVFGKDKKSVTLYGEVKVVQARLNIIADKAKYDDASKIVYAKNVSFTSDLYNDPVIAKFVKFDLRDGSYQVLSNIPDL
jgi:hypothetical protein